MDQNDDVFPSTSLPDIRDAKNSSSAQRGRGSMFKSRSSEILVDNVGNLLSEARVEEKAIQAAIVEKEEEEKRRHEQNRQKKIKLQNAKKERAEKVKTLMSNGQAERKTKARRILEAKRKHGGIVEDSRQKRKAEESKARRKALLGYASVLKGFSDISATVEKANASELLALERKAHREQMQWYKEQAMDVERTLLQRDALRRSSLVLTDRVESTRQVSRPIGPFTIPSTLDEWHEFKDALPLTGSPAAGAFFFVVALLENNMSHADELGSMALKDALSPRCTRDLLEHEIDDMMTARRWSGVNDYQIKRGSTLSGLDDKHYSGAAGAKVEHPKVIRSYTKDKIDRVKIRQVAKLLHPEHMAGVLSKKYDPSSPPQCTVTFNWSEARRDLASHGGKSAPVTIHVDVPAENDDFNPEKGPRKPWFKMEYDDASKRFRVHSFGNMPSALPNIRN